MSHPKPHRDERPPVALRLCVGLVLALSLFALHDAITGPPLSHIASSSAQTIADQEPSAPAQNMQHTAAAPDAAGALDLTTCGILVLCFAMVAAVILLVLRRTGSRWVLWQHVPPLRRRVAALTSVVHRAALGQRSLVLIC